MAAIAGIPSLTLASARWHAHRKAMNDKTDKTNWTGKAALAGAAIGSAALAAALLYASRRKERARKALPKPETGPLAEPPETD
jgi:Na+/H+-translocating membrane pyrophosphatase